MEAHVRFGYDFSGGWPGVAAIQAAGGSFIGRYLVYDHPRGLQAFEAQAADAAGIDIIGFYEEGETAILQGAPFGQRAAQNAMAVAREAGVWTPVTVFLAADYDLDGSAMPAINAALDACAAIIGRNHTGIYGGVLPVHLARAEGKAQYAVQAGAWRYRASQVGVTDPYGWSPLAQVRQDGYNQYIGGINVDHLTALAGDFGQFRLHGAIDPTPPEPASSPWDPHQFDHKPLLKQGDMGEDVKTVQYVLNFAFHGLAVDGVFGEKTGQAVAFWQKLAGLTADGVVGAKTWASFGAYVARVHRFDRMPTVTMNSTDANTTPHGGVHPIQQALNAVGVPGHTPIKVDGAYGPITRDTVAQYQRNRRLPADGVTGKATWTDIAALMTVRGK